MQHRYTFISYLLLLLLHHHLHFDLKASNVDSRTTRLAAATFLPLLGDRGEVRSAGWRGARRGGARRAWRPSWHAGPRARSRARRGGRGAAGGPGAPLSCCERVRPCECDDGGAHARAAARGARRGRGSGAGGYGWWRGCARGGVSRASRRACVYLPRHVGILLCCSCPHHRFCFLHSVFLFIFLCFVAVQ